MVVSPEVFFLKESNDNAFLGSKWMREGENHEKHHFQKSVISQGRGLVENVLF